MKFKCKCYSQQNDVIEEVIEATDQDEAKLKLMHRGLIVLSLKEHISVDGIKNSKSGKFSLLLFSHELQALLKAGLSLIEAIEALHEKEYRPATKNITEKLLKSLFEGVSLSNALEFQPQHFPQLFIAMVRASEQTGDLVNTLKNYVNYRAQVDLVKKKIISASIYPAILIIVGSLVIFFLMLYVVPKFSAIYESKSSNLPWMSELLLAWGRALHEHGRLTIAIVSGVLLFIFFLLSQKNLQQKIIARLLATPSLAEKYKIYILARFYRSVGMLLKGGIPIITSIEMSASVLAGAMQPSVSAAIQDIKDGNSISTAMEKNHLCTPVAIRMLRVGERSGQMGEMMQYIGEFYDEDIARWLDWFTKLFEPILMLFIGLIVGLIVVLMYMPIFELAGSLQ